MVNLNLPEFPSCARAFMVKLAKLSTHSHMEHIQAMNLNIGEGTPDVEVVVNLGKDERLSQKRTCVQRQVLRIQNVLGRRDVGRHAFVNTVLDMRVRLQGWSTMIAKVFIVWNNMGRHIVVMVDLTHDQSLHNNKDGVADGNSCDAS